MTRLQRSLFGSAVLAWALTACAPDTPQLSALEVPVETLTAIATRDFEPSATPAPPTRTPQPTTPPSATAPPTPTPTVAPVVIDPAAARISRFSPGTAPRLSTLLMLDARAGWAVSDPILDGDDHVLTTADSGFTWREVTPPQPVSPEWPRGSEVAATALDPATAWVAFFDRSQTTPTVEAWVWRTVDGGASWATSQPLPLADRPGYLPIELSFSDAASGWLLAAVGGGADRGTVVVLGTRDGGQSWQALSEFAPDEAGCQYTGLRRLSAQRGYLFASCRGAMTAAPILRETDDGGQTWTAVPLVRPTGFPVAFPGSCRAQAAYADAAELALIVDCLNTDNNVQVQYLYSSDNELRELAPLLIDGRLESHGLFSPGAGLLLVDTEPNNDGPLTVIEVRNGAGLTQRRRVGWRGQVVMVSQSTGWAVYSVGISGRTGLLRTTDGGATWGEVKPVVR